MKTGLLLCFLLVCSLTVARRHHRGPGRQGQGGERPEKNTEEGQGRRDNESREEAYPEPTDPHGDWGDHDGFGDGEEEEADGGHGEHGDGHGDTSGGDRGGRVGKFMQGDRQGMGHGNGERARRFRMRDRERGREDRRQGRPGGHMFLRFFQRRPHILCTICTVLNNTQVKEATVKALTEDNTCQQKREAEKQKEGPSHGHPAGHSHMNPPDMKNATAVSEMYDRIMKKICEPKLRGKNREN